jgi:hypothetical protein
MKGLSVRESRLSFSHKLITNFRESEEIGFESDNYLLTYTL